MSIKSDIDTLVSDVGTRKATALKSKGALDATVRDGASAAGQAEGAALAALSARDEASGMVTMSGALAAASVGATAYEDLAAVVASKVENAVDLFIYDTSLDSDGGAWRDRCTGTSWYKEAPGAKRGTRREFPAVAVLVAELDRRTIYDGDDPALPLWMQFIEGQDFLNAAWEISALSARNGIIAVGMRTTYGNLQQYDFVKDRKSMYRRSPTFNAYGAYDSAPLRYSGAINGPVSVGLVSERVTDIAMAVLPDAPLDPVTGLAVPTIVAATENGITLLKHDASYQNAAIGLVRSCTILGQMAFVQKAAAGDPTYAVDLTKTPSPFVQVFDYNDGLVFPAHIAASGADLVIRSDRAPFGMSRMMIDATGAVGAEAHLRSSFATGWLPGDIKGAWLADTDTASLAAGNMISGDNATFTNSVGDWQARYTASIASLSGELVVTSGANPQHSRAVLAIPTTPGAAYRVSVFARAGGDANAIMQTSDQGGSSYWSGFSVATASTSGETLLEEFTAVWPISYIALGFQGSSAPEGTSNSFDDFSIEEVAPDRSAKAQGLTVHGWITRSPVAPGAELVAYSGFSADNYLEATDEAYTGSLYALGWEQTNGVWEFRHGIVSAAPIDGLTVTGNTVRIAGTRPKALIRLTATVPTADQLARIERDERALFQPGAACTLFGSSDAVTALAHDTVTGLLHVGTSAGRSVFDGLCRVAHSTQPIGRAIAAHNGLIIEG